jgi:hypothetical protein
MLRFLVLASCLELFLPYNLIEEMLVCFIYLYHDLSTSFLLNLVKNYYIPTTTTMLDNTSDEGDAAMDESTE